MIEPIHPAIIYFGGALLMPFLRERTRRVWLILVPLLALWDLSLLSRGTRWTYEFLGYNLIFGRIDALSMCFAWVFAIIGLIGLIYALHVKGAGEHIAALFYIGGSIGAVFAGDLFTLFIFWEIMSGASVFLIWFQREKSAVAAGFRYLLFHVFGGSSLFAGIILYVSKTGSTLFGTIEPWNSAAGLMILLGFTINAAVPPLHAWLSDAYPEGTISGAVFLSAYTTKTAVYTLIRGFPGVDLLAWAGAIMTVYGVIFAVLENDIRRLLAYHIISQVGYMVCGVGLGSTMSLNGSAAHAFCHILYKGLLFMGAGAVIYSSGTRKLSEMGGLWRLLPLTMIMYMIGGLSISGAPLLNGFVSKSIIIEAAGRQGRGIIQLLLELAAVGTYLSTTLKLPYSAFFKERKEPIKVRKPPLNMLFAMGLASFLCFLLGIKPHILYRILPFQMDYHPYTYGHIVGTIQLLLFTTLGFVLMLPKLQTEPAITLDIDWFYRKFGGAVAWFCTSPLNIFNQEMQQNMTDLVRISTKIASDPAGVMDRITHAIVEPFKLMKSKRKVEEAAQPEIEFWRYPSKQAGVGVFLSLALFTILAYILIKS